MGSLFGAQSLIRMSLQQIIGQPRVVDVLRRTLQSKRVAHAFLFHGPEGVGKATAALAMVDALQCEQPVDGDACGVCGSCHKVRRGLHPDVHILMPVPKETDDNERAARIAMFVEDPYQTVDFQTLPSLDGTSGRSGQVIYSKANMYDWLRKPMSYHRVEGRYRVAILLDADWMREEAANAFLKLLEEPGQQTVFILITNRVDHLLTTILSRCQKIRFDALDREDIALALQDRGIPDQAAQTLSRMAGGSLRKAISLASNEDLLGTREEVMGFLRKSYQGKGDTVVAAVDTLSRSGREGLRFRLMILLGILRDLLLLQTSGSSDLIVNVDQIDTLTRFANNLPNARLQSMIEATEQTMFLVERNVNARLSLVNLSRVLQGAMRGDPGRRVEIDIVD